MHGYLTPRLTPSQAGGYLKNKKEEIKEKPWKA
jgi:hypothetical protein